MVKVTMLASGRKEDCGINTYTTSLEHALTVDHERVGIKSRTTDLHHYVRRTVAALRSPGDVVHVQHEYGVFGPASICSWAVVLLLLFGKSLARKRVVVTLHSAWNETTPDPPLVPLKSFYIWLNNRLWLLAADHVIFLSEGTYENFAHRHDIENYTVTTHGVQTEAVEDRTSEEAKAALDREEFLVVLPGYIRPEKGHDTFLKIAKRVPETQFVIAGGERTEDHADFVDDVERSAPDNVDITGVLDETEFHDWFLASDLVLLPYEEVTQSGIFNWAAAYGCPMVVKESDYFRALREETDGIRCFTDVAEAADLVRTLRDDPETRSAMAEALEDYREDNSMEKIADLHRSVYVGEAD